MRVVNQRIEADDFEKLCNRTLRNTTIDATTLPAFCGCSKTIFEDVSLINLEISNWKINATFNRVTFQAVNFSNIVFENSPFANCSMEGVRFDSVYFGNSPWYSTSLSGSELKSVSFCDFDAQDVSIAEVSTTDVVINGRTIPNVNHLSEATFFQLLPPVEESNCSKWENPEINCRKEDDNRIYKDSFLIATSALPGNVLSAVAVYFLRRNYWLGQSWCGQPHVLLTA